MGLTGEQHILTDAPPEQGIPLRQWWVQVACLNEDGEVVPATFLDRVVYKLHPTFANPNRTVKKPPFMVKETGWGEFDMGIVMHYADNGGSVTVRHDLNFQSEDYTVDHVLSISTARPGLARLLLETGPVPGLDTGSVDDGGAGRKKRKSEAPDALSGASTPGTDSKKQRSRTKPVDMERLAEGLQRLDEDALLHVVQLIDDHKTADTYVKNDIDEGEFHVDLYTLSDTLLVSLWTFTSGKLGLE